MGAATQDGQPVRGDETGKMVLMNSRREETALEASTFVPTDLYFLDKIFPTSGVTKVTADLASQKGLSLSILESIRDQKVK